MLKELSLSKVLLSSRTCLIDFPNIKEMFNKMYRYLRKISNMCANIYYDNVENMYREEYKLYKNSGEVD